MREGRERARENADVKRREKRKSERARGMERREVVRDTLSAEWMSESHAPLAYCRGACKESQRTSEKEPLNER